MSLTPEEHKARHKILHEHLDELLADYIEQHPNQVTILDRPLIELLTWSYQQTMNPTELAHRYVSSEESSTENPPAAVSEQR